MNKRSIMRFVLASVLGLSVILIGCGKSSNPMAPSGGGGPAGGAASDTPFNSGTLSAPASFSHVFPTAGTVTYHCNFHVSMGMVGTVVVASGGAASVTVTANGTSFSPSTVTIMPGGTVNWSIAGGTHTVTSD